MLGVTRNDESIAASRPRHAVDTGIEYRVLVPGLVPPYEEHDARISAGYTLPMWDALGPEGRALEVACYRARRLVALHSQDAQAAEAERQMKHKGKG